MEIVINLSDDVYTRLFDNGAETSQSDRMDIETAIRRGVPIAFNYEDAVSRKDVVKILGRIEQRVFDGEGFDYEKAMAEIDDLPSVIPKE